MGWTTEEDKKVLSLREAGHSYKDIATIMLGEFQRKFTKDSVRNRIDRLKCSPRMASEKKTPKLRVRTTEEFIPIQEEKVPSIPEYNYKDEVEIGKDGVQRSDKLLRMNEAERKDPDFLMEAHGYDPKEWEIISSKSSMWNQHNQEDKTIVLYSSKISVKPRNGDIHIDKLKEFLENFSHNYDKPKHTPSQYHKKGKILEVNICDLHLNKLADISTSGDTYNTEIASKRFFYIIDDIITRVNGYEFEKILFIIGNDFYNVDNLIKTTTGGTPQDVHSNMYDMFKRGVEILVEAIDLLTEIAPVEAVLVGGNHDTVTSYFASEYLHAWFRNDPNVEVDNRPVMRKYKKFGKCLLQLSHGNSEKKRLGNTMQIEVPQWWGETRFREVHAGHIHSQKQFNTIEDGGVVIRHLSSASGSDTWHFNSGYVGAIKQAQTFIWDKEYGIENIIHTVVPEGM